MLMQRFVAPVVDGLPEEPSSGSGQVVRSLQTARAPRESLAEYLDSSAPVEVMRKRLQVLRAQKTHMWRCPLERQVIERQHSEDHAVLDRRRRDMDRTVPTKTLIGTQRTNRI